MDLTPSEQGDTVIQVIKDVGARLSADQRADYDKELAAVVNPLIPNDPKKAVVAALQVALRWTKTLEAQEAENTPWGFDL